MKEGLIAKSVTKKNNSRVDCAEACKKTVQALHFGTLSELTRKGEDFWRLGILPAKLAVMNFHVMHDRISPNYKNTAWLWSCVTAGINTFAKERLYQFCIATKLNTLF